MTASSTSGPVGRHTEHYLDVVERYRAAPMRSYHFHHLMVNFQIIGPFDLRAFRAAIDELARRNPIFRSTFRKVDGAWRQVIAAAPPAGLLTHRGSDVADWRAVTREAIIAENDKIISVETGPLVQFSVIQFKDAAVFLTKVHHIACDGWGIWVAMNQLLGLYMAALAGPDALAAAPVPRLADADLLAFAAAERESLAAPEGRATLDWWKSYLGDHPFVRTPLPERPQGFLNAVAHRLDSATSGALERIAKARGIHVSYLLHAAYMKALAEHTASDDLLVTFVKANRNERNSAVAANFADWVMVRHRRDLTLPLADLAAGAALDVGEAKDNYQPYWHIVHHVAPGQYFNDFGLTPYSFDFMPYLDPKLDFGQGVAFVLLREMEVFPFRLTATDIFCRASLMGNLANAEQVVELILVYHAGYLTEARVRAVLERMTAELVAAAR